MGFESAPMIEIEPIERSLNPRLVKEPAKSELSGTFVENLLQTGLHGRVNRMLAHLPNTTLPVAAN